MSLAAFPAMMRRARQRLGLRECRAAWPSGRRGSSVRAAGRAAEIERRVREYLSQ
jgi:hypothetical protein